MTLKEKINQDLKDAMKSQDKIRLQTVRSIRALILEYEKSGAVAEMTPDDELKLISGAVKKRRDSIEQFRNGGREDLAKNEEAELNILLQYMPKQLTDDEIFEEIKKLAATIGASQKEDFSKLMPLSAKELKGKAEGKTIKTLVEKFLGI